MEYTMWKGVLENFENLNAWNTILSSFLKRFLIDFVSSKYRIVQRIFNIPEMRKVNSEQGFIPAPLSY